MKRKSNSLVNFVILLFILVFVILIYLPVIQYHYVNYADYIFLWTYDSKATDAQSFISFIHAQYYEGRFLDNLYYYVTYNKYINSLKSIDAAGTVRFIGIMGIGLFAFVLYLIFKKHKFRSIHAFLLSLSVSTLPPMWKYVSILFVTHLIYSALLSALAALVMFKVVWKEERQKTGQTVIAIVLAVFLLFLSLNIYQPTAMIYWAMALIPLMKLKNEHFIKKWGGPITIYFITGIAAMIIYFVIIKIIYFLMNVVLQSRNAFVTISDILPQLIWFIQTPLKIASNLWYVDTSDTVTYCVSLIIVLGMLIGFKRMILKVITERERLNILLNALCRYLLVLSLIPLSYLPMLVIKYYGMQPIAYHRTLIGLEIIILLLLYWSLTHITELLQSSLTVSEKLNNIIFTTAMIIVTVISSLFANYYTEKYFAEFSADEISYVKNAINEYGATNLSTDTKIQILADATPSIEAIYRFTISNLTHATSIVKPHAISMVKLALYELGVNSDIPIEYFRTDESLFPDDKNVLVIDMREFHKETYEELSRPLSFESLYKNMLLVNK